MRTPPLHPPEEPPSRPTLTADNEFAAFAAQLQMRAERMREGGTLAARRRTVEDLRGPSLVRNAETWASGLLLACVGVVALAVWGWPIQPDKPPTARRVEPAKVEAMAIPVRTEAVATRIALPPVAVPAPPPEPPRFAQSAPPSAAPPAATPAPPVSAAAPASAPAQAPVQAPATEVAAAPLSWDDVRELQSRLKAAGFDPGPVDGIVGPRTTEAARRFAEARVLTSAEPSTFLLACLRAEPTQSAELNKR
jgi:hypothetical protein